MNILGKAQKVHKFLLDCFDHIHATWTDKYAGSDVNGVDVIDLLKSHGMFENHAIACVCKYVVRYKTTRNTKDLLKAVHYIQELYNGSVPEKLNHANPKWMDCELDKISDIPNTDNSIGCVCGGTQTACEKGCEDA